MNPLVSIIIPCYNQAQYLEDALQSVLEQTYTNWECLIINDGSPDDTEKIVKKWLIKDTRFNYFYKENGGLSSARNLGLEKATGDYIQFLDSDDVLSGKKLELSLQQLDSSKNELEKVVISNFQMFVDTPNQTSVPYCNLNIRLFNFENLLYQWGEAFTIPIHCGLFKASLFEEFRFPEELKAKEDWVMWVSIFHKDCKAFFIDLPLALYRKNVESMTMTKDMLPDFIKAYSHFKKYLTEEEFFDFSVLLISRYYKSNNVLKDKLSVLKLSNTYQTGLLIKKVLKVLRLLPLSRKLFSHIIKLKSK